MKITPLSRPISLGRKGRDTPKTSEVARNRRAFEHDPGVL